MFYIFDIIEQFDINVLISLIKENPFYVIENLVVEVIMFLILYFFVTKKKYGFYNIFFTGFSSIVTKNLGEKFTDNYLFYSVNMIFFLLTFFIYCYSKFIGLNSRDINNNRFINIAGASSFYFFYCSFYFSNL